MVLVACFTFVCVLSMYLSLAFLLVVVYAKVSTRPGVYSRWPQEKPRHM